MRFLPILLLFCVLGLRAAAVEPGAAEGTGEGLRLYFEQRYEEALQQFQAARAAGGDTPELRLNLGSTYYKLGRHAEARAEFDPLLTLPAVAPLAHYNLGLTAQREGNLDAAASHFEAAAKTARDPEVTRLAERARAALPGAGILAVPAAGAALPPADVPEAVAPAPEAVPQTNAAEPAAAQPTGNSAAQFAEGVRLFQAQRYEDALGRFLAARAAGLETPELQFNLGSSYYKLGRYAEARVEFQRLLTVPTAAPLAKYNLGLVALRQKDLDAATSHFEQAATTAQDPNLKALAQRALARVKGAPAAPAEAVAPKRFQTLISLGGGYDDNVTLSADLELLDLPAAEDEFAEALLASQIQLRGNRERGERLVLTGYVRRHDEIDQFDQSVAQASFFVDRKLGSWYTSIGAGADTVYLDDERFSSTGTGTLEARHLLPFNSALGLRYQGSYTDASGQFESITGQRHTLRGTLTNRYGIAQTQLGYEFETNDRKDLDLDDGQFFSRSPQSHTVFLANATQLTRRLSLQPRVEYRFSRYPDDDQRLFLISPATEDNPAVLGLDEKERHDERFRAAARAEFLLTKSVFLHGQYEYTDSRSNYEEFDYDRHTVSGGVGASF